METLIAYPKNEAQETALKAIFKALNVPFDEKRLKVLIILNLWPKFKRGKKTLKLEKVEKLLLLNWMIYGNNLFTTSR